jgi:NUMOD1 domain
MKTVSNTQPNRSFKQSKKPNITKSLLNKGPVSTETKNKQSKKENKNCWQGKSLNEIILNRAVKLKGIKVYVYNSNTFELFNNKPFRSIQKTVKQLPISSNTLSKKLDSGIPFKGYYYYSNPQSIKPK